MTPLTPGSALGPAVSVLIVAYNSKPLIDRTLAALAVQTMGDFEAIVLDNASPDGPPVLPADPRFRLIASPSNLGFAGGNNRAAAEARAPWLALLNPDAFPEPDWLEKLLAAAAAHEGAGTVGSLQKSADEPGLLDGTGDCYHFAGVAWRGLYGRPEAEAPPTGEVFGPCAAAALYRRDVFQALGGFDEDFFCYHEDVDLAFRFRLAGWRCVQSAEAKVAHVGSASTGRHSEFAVFHGVRNRVWTFFKDMPLPLLLMLTPFFVAGQIFLLTRVGEETKPATIRGLKAGFAGLPKIWAKRRAVQKTRRAPLAAIAQSFTWDPYKVFRREHDVRPWR